MTLYEATVDDEGAYLVSELVSGPTLAELVEARRLSDRDIAQIGVALCDALAHAHAEGVVHRDVKPSNVLIPDRVSTPAQLAKLTDFGVARVIGGDSLTRTGDVVGTAAYMAPEQAEGRPAGAAADLYSLALVLYEALTGVNPLRAGAPARRARRLGAYLPPVRRHRRDLPRELGRAIDAALRPRPRERGTVEELRQALDSSVRQLGDAPSAIEAPVEEAPARPADSGWARGDELEIQAPANASLPARMGAAAGAAIVAGWIVAFELHGPAVATAAVSRRERFGGGQPASRGVAWRWGNRQRRAGDPGERRAGGGRRPRLACTRDPPAGATSPLATGRCGAGIGCNRVGSGVACARGSGADDMATGSAGGRGLGVA